MADRSLPEVGQIIAGKYRVERLLGAGGMGSVYEVSHQVTGKGFAVKWLLPDLSTSSDAVKRFIREAQVAGRFEHPNVVEVYDVGQERGSFYMVMELLNGESLADQLKRRGRFSANEACAVIVPCLRGVARAHQAGIVHRDLKPDNIFMCAASDGRVERPKVLDFGISKMSELQGEVAASITKTGMVMGTPHYMSPEQIRGRNMDHRVDVYAFGVILYQLLSGELPFPGDTYSELVLKIATETPPPLGRLVPGLSPALIAIVERAMARSPDERFGSLEEMARALEQLPGPRTAIAAAQRHGATPSGGTLRLETPLATESQPLPIPAGLGKGSARPLVWVLGAIGVAVLGLAALALNLLGGETAAEGDAQPPPTTAAASGAVEEPAKDEAPPENPQPKTVRIGPEPQPREPNAPEAPAADAPDAPTSAAADQPAAATPAIEPTTGFKRPNQAAADRERAEEERRQRRAERQRRPSRTSRARSTRPASSSSSTTPPRPDEPAPSETQRAPGRLRVKLGPEDF